MRRAVVVLALLALVGVVGIGLSQAGGGDEAENLPPFDLAETRQALAGAPPQLAGLHEQSAQILDEGKAGFERRLKALKGTPIVVNKWASWCRPCRAEFPYFQHLAGKRGKEIAFLGLHSGDALPAGEKFLKEFPVPYPSYEDPDEKLAATLDAFKYYPITIFIGADGKVAYLHPGEYHSLADLEADIERYL
jgi:cytochrome c biogenesis protein CcmG/thiol:disulfide interchange protein DsbE